MPRCERCHVCVVVVDAANAGKQRREEEKGCCLRKMCCNIPTELKLQPMDTNNLGFPKGWQFCFDDPQKTLLVGGTSTTDRDHRSIFSLAGLKLLSPYDNDNGKRKVFHSLESAFAHLIPSSSHDAKNSDSDSSSGSIGDSVGLLERFLAHVGSSRYASVPDHFLMGKSYCIEFTYSSCNSNNDNHHHHRSSSSSSSSNSSNTIVLYGKIVACMGRPSSGADNGEAVDNGNHDTDENDDDNKLAFVVRYDSDMLSIAKSMMGTTTTSSIIRPLQLINSAAAWGGCISYERKIHCRRDSQSAIQNIDQATAAETWVAPDMRFEELVERAKDDDDDDNDDDDDGGTIRLPQLTVVARGYKFVFRAKVSDHGNGKRSYGVFATCASMPRNAHQVINLKPGELIDLGIFAPLRKEDETSLPAFIVKNYIHHLRAGRWGVASGEEDNVVYDLTDDKTGMLHDAASKKTLSYIRKRAKGELPTIHVRLDPSGCAHLLFGIQYKGNWEQYERGVQDLVPLFCGMEVEVTVDRQHGLGKKSVAGSKYMQSIGLFQLHDIAACGSYLDRIFDDPKSMDQLPPALIDRSKQVVKCLGERAQKLLNMLEDSKSYDKGVDFSFLRSTLGRLKELSIMLDGLGK